MRQSVCDAVAVGFLASLLFPCTHACSNILVTPGASADGSVRPLSLTNPSSSSLVRRLIFL